MTELTLVSIRCLPGPYSEVKELASLTLSHEKLAKDSEEQWLDLAKERQATGKLQNQHDRLKSELDALQRVKGEAWT